MVKLDPLSEEFIAFVNVIIDSPALLEEIISEVQSNDTIFYSSMGRKWLKTAANEKMVLGATEHGNKMLLPQFSEEMLDKEIANEQLDKIIYTAMKRFKSLKK